MTMPDFRIRAFLDWLRRTGQKPDTFLFKNQREAAEFVRRVYNQSGAPNKELRAVYGTYKKLKTHGVVPRSAARPEALRKAV